MLAPLLTISIVAAVLAGSLLGVQHPTPTPAQLFTATPSAGREGSERGVRIVIVVDNYICSPGLREAWGLSIYVEIGSHTILFDTGPNPVVLRSNAQVLGIDLGRIEAVVLSHEHGDHVGGLPAIAEVRHGIPVYVPAGSGPMLFKKIRSLGLTPISVNTSGVTVVPGVVIVGPLRGPPPEQGLVIVTPRGAVLLVGCSHPGVVNLVREAKRVTGRRVVAVIGGSHLFAATESIVRRVIEELISEGVEKVYPIHCSGDLIRSILSSEYPWLYGDGCAGKVITFNASRS